MRWHCHYLLLAALSIRLCSSQAQEKPAPRQGQPRNSDRLSPKLRSMHLTGEPAQVIRQAFHLYGIDVLFAGPMQGSTRQLQLHLVDADLSTTGEVLAGMTRCFFVPVNKHLVMAVQDNKAHRSQYQPLFTETIEVANLRSDDAEERSEIEGLLRAVFGIPQVAMHGNSVTVRTTKRELLQIEDTLTHLFQPEPQVLLEVKAYLVSRSYEPTLGIAPPQGITVFNVDSEAESLISSNSSVVAALIAAGVASAGDTVGIAEALIAEGYGSNSVLNSPFVTVGGGITTFGVQFGSVSANASLTVSSSRQLQSATLQLANGQSGKLRVGQRYPVETASTTAVGGSSSSSTPSIQYEDLGLTLEAKPQVMSGGEVLLHIHETFRSLAGTSLNNIPIIENQEFVSDLSVPAGVTTVVVSDLTRTEARIAQGFTDLVPTDGSLNQQTSELLVTVSPHVTRASSR